MSIYQPDKLCLKLLSGCFLFVLWAGLFALICPAMYLDSQRLHTLAEQRYGRPGTYAVDCWFSLQQQCAHLPVAQQLERVNTFFNQRTRYVDDRLTWKQTDYWATPLETLGLGQGDCEDFSFAKYVTLHLMGIPVEQLRLIYVRARIMTVEGPQNQAHMVLGYYPTPNSPPLILDNLIEKVLPATQRSDLFPVFSFNTQELWISGRTTSAGNSLSRLSNWRDVLRRMHEEGIN
ncbi:MAG: transglutaminase-like cysteine peptidase [Desulfuromonadaceae bacterium]|nr:transglutaminase-like cysteine peptidase [Desulfuromonadaceae bacterium]